MREGEEMLATGRRTGAGNAGETYGSKRLIKSAELSVWCRTLATGFNSNMLVPHKKPEHAHIAAAGNLSRRRGQTVSVHRMRHSQLNVPQTTTKKYHNVNWKLSKFWDSRTLLQTTVNIRSIHNKLPSCQREFWSTTNERIKLPSRKGGGGGECQANFQLVKIYVLLSVLPAGGLFRSKVFILVRSDDFFLLKEPVFLRGGTLMRV